MHWLQGHYVLFTSENKSGVWGFLSPCLLSTQITILKKVKQCYLAIRSSPRIESGWGDLRPHLLGNNIGGWAVCAGGSLGNARGNGTCEAEMVQNQREREAGLWCSHNKGLSPGVRELGVWDGPRELSQGDKIGTRPLYPSQTSLGCELPWVRWLPSAEGHSWRKFTCGVQAAHDVHCGRHYYWQKRCLEMKKGSVKTS